MLKKVLRNSFWFMLGAVVGVLTINYRVIGANVGDISTVSGQAVWNLHDHLLNYLIFFVAGALVFGILLLSFNAIKRFNTKP